MPTCPSCHSTSPMPAWQYKNTPIYACPMCDLQFAYPTQAAPLDYYQSHYNELIAATLEDKVHPGYQFIIEKIREVTRRDLTPDQRQVIDIGCGPGYVLAQLASWGFDCFGIDFNPDVIRVANEHFHLNAKVAKVEDLLALDTRYDLALLLHVLEHVDEPGNLLKDISQLLKPNGVLFIDLPNRNRFTLRRSLKKGSYPAGDYPPHHITFWSVATLSRALKLSGFTVIQCHARPFGSEGQIAVSLKYRLHLRDGRVLNFLTRSIQAISHFLNLQGETIYAVAQRVN